MRFFLAILSIIILSAIIAPFSPWWIIAVITFLVCLVLGTKAGSSFFAGFLGIAIYWLIMALIKDIPNEHILSTRMAKLFQLPGYGLFMVVTIFIGGLVGGMAALSAAYIRKAFS